MSMPLVDSLSRRRALGWLAAGTGAAVCASPGLSQPVGPVVEPEDFGPIADGKGDAAPLINAAIAELVRRGGGTLRFRNGKTYPLIATVDATAVSSEAFRSSIAIPPGAENLTIDLNGATLIQQSQAFTFGSAYRLFNDKMMKHTRQPLDYTPRLGDRSIRVPNGSTYAPGARVVLVSGNVNAAQKTYVPIAEMFVVLSAHPGVIFIDRPVQKDHAVARAREIGLIDISRAYAQGLALVGPGRVVNRYRRAGVFLQVFGLHMDHLAFEGSGGFSIRGRDIVVTDCQVTIIRGPDDSFRPYAIAFDTGSNDITVERFTARGQPFCYIHLNEALSNVRLYDIELRNVWDPDPSWLKGTPAISIMGLSWNVTLENVLIVNNPQGGGIGAAESTVMGEGNHGLTLRNITLRGGFRNAALGIHDRNPASVNGLDLREVRLAPGQRALSLSGAMHDIAGVRE